MSHQHIPKQNRLLAALPDCELDELSPHFELISLKAGELLAEAERSIPYVYFPIDSAISLFYRLENGESAGVAVIGNEGMFSIIRIFGGKVMPYWATVETSGHVLRIDTNRLIELLDEFSGLHEVLLLYAQASLIQVAQTVVCEKHHSVQQQLSQHLLLINDKSLADDFNVTHEAIANMLGVRRESITEAAGELRDQGVIAYSRGHVRILDRPRLEKMCCECYGVVQREFGRLFGRQAER